METHPVWLQPVKFLKGVGPARAALLEKELGIVTVHDLLHLFPNRYVDRSKVYRINELQWAPADVQVYGKIASYRIEGSGKTKRLVAVLEDGDAALELVWFRNYGWVSEKFPPGTPVVVYGKLNWFGKRVSMVHPEIETAESFKQRGYLGLVPVYPSTEKLTKRGVTNKVFRQIMFDAFQNPAIRFSETLPGWMLRDYQLTGKDEAMRSVHFPKDMNSLSRAQYRLKFEELFFLQLQLLYKNRYRKAKIKGHVFEKVGDYFNRFYKEVLPFDLTGAQKRVVREIRRDLRSGTQMNRLLQGDVGSGKTVVAMLSMLLAVDNGFQAAMLAPTEILATQHFQNLKKWADALGLEIALLTGSTKKSERKILLDDLKSGRLHILVGTHALLEDNVQFRNLGLTVIDEQHRFGVAQRAKMWKKNQIPPHMLIMTATPIPRTLAMSHYGDLDVSVIDELPPGRKPVETHHLYARDAQKAYNFVRRQVKAGRQAYIVFPLIEESKVLDLESLMEGYDRLAQQFVPSGIRMGMVHGAMKPAEKEAVMQAFKRGDIDVLVSTTVIEVGVDVPNATVMIIESAQRFGLSQLHQLRGRVGRGADKSYCILITDGKLSEEARTRIRTMIETNDGFRIAEADLRLRGPGNIMGTQQSGMMRLKIADLVKDGLLMQRARNAAARFLEKDPGLQLPEHQTTVRIFKENFRKAGFWNFIG